MARAVVGNKVAKSERGGRDTFLETAGQCFHAKNTFFRKRPTDIENKLMVTKGERTVER